MTPFTIGQSSTVDLMVTETDQRAFSALSGDTNPIHLDATYAQSRGFAGPVVYGGLIVAALSRVIGLQLPGSNGVWSSLQIDFRAPLIVGQPAAVLVEVVQISEAARTLVMKVTVNSGSRTIATGRAMATLFA